MDDVPVELCELGPGHNMPFLKKAISQIGLRTPPPSPENSKSSPHRPRLLIAKFLRRTQPTRSTNFLASNGSPVDGAPQLTFPGAENATSHPTCSPFRAVQHMKEPFPLVLPASPAPSDHSANERSTPQRLRKAPLSYQNLRAARQDQPIDSTLSQPIALLPSPVLSELPVDQISASYFISDTSNNQQSSPDRPGQASPLYEEHGFVSSFCDNHEAQSYCQHITDANRASPDVTQRHDTRRDVGIVCAPGSFPQYQRRPRRDRSRSCSSEADWLAGKMSEKIMLEEWLYDLRQSEISPPNQDEEDSNHHQVMHATRLGGAGKPKLINILRPASLSTPSPSVLNELRPPCRPATPLRPCQEISVFSPDTPVKCSRRASTYSSTSLRPAPLSPDPHHWRYFATTQKPPSGPSQSIRSLLERSSTESQPAHATDVSNHTVATPSRTPPPVFSPASEATAWSRCRKLERILEAVSEAMDTFPNDMLRLDSPAILALRAPHSLDEMHIAALQRIFPQTDSLSLSALAALLIVDCYFSSPGDMCSPSRSLSDRPSEHTQGKLTAGSDECLRDTPIKARATLGIHLPSITDVQDRERALKRRADMVAMCVGVQGQRLLEAICGRFDPVAWKALKVLVETLESNRP